MADLPDYYTQTAISEAEAAGLKGGLDANKSAAPVSRDIYLATDTHILYVCFTDGAWVNMNALYLLLAGGTMSGNIAMGTKKLTGLGAPASQNDSLRYGQAEIRNAEIAAAAEIAYEKLDLYLGIVNLDIAPGATIAYTKLFLTAQIVMADLAAAIKNAANGIVVLDASADVPDAQIPDLAAGKITSDRFPVDRLPAMTDEKIWKGTGGNVEEVDMPSGWATLTVAETEVFSGITPTTWTDLDLSGTVGSNVALVLLKIGGGSFSGVGVAFRKNGDTDEFFAATSVTGVGAALIEGLTNVISYVFVVAADATGKVEWKTGAALDSRTVDIIAYIK